METRIYSLRVICLDGREHHDTLIQRSLFQ